MSMPFAHWTMSRRCEEALCRHHISTEWGRCELDIEDAATARAPGIALLLIDFQSSTSIARRAYSHIHENHS
ncbi:hypothetical protein DI005_33650 [Prauserella sp. PE36]|nr:hypothetical protein BAY59_11600 [Prauserella coralliicola]RBM11584.1 hypothetical protein DI005_33650 [Prauserella sp. PE36]